MKEVDITSKVVGRDTSGKAAMYIPGAGAPSVNLDDYLLKKIWDSVFETRTDSEGNPYLFEKLPFVTQYGITMYADGGELDLPSIYAGIPFDNKTIWLNPETGLVEVLGGTGGGSGEGVSNFWDLSNIPSWITATKPKYSYSEIEGTPDLSGYATETYVEDRLDDLINGAPAAYDTLKEIADVLAGNVNSIGDIITTLGTKADKATTLAGYGITDAYTKSDVNTLLGDYVTLATAQTITGKKDFTTGGLFVNGKQIQYIPIDGDSGYWKLEGDLLVTGGITMYANEGTYTPSTIMNGLVLDSATLGINDEGRLYVKGGTGGGVADSVAWENVTGKPSFAAVATSGKYSDLSGVPTLLSSFTDDVVTGKYLPLSGGTINSEEQIPITITSNHSNAGIGIFLKNSNNVNPSGYVLANAQLGYTLNNGVYMFNYANYSSYNCAIGITNEGVAYVGKGDNIDTKYAIWHEGNLTPSNYLLASAYTASDVLSKLKTVDGSGSGLDADLLDGLQGNSYWKAITEYSTGSNGADTTTSPNFLGYASGLSGFRYFLTTFYGNQSTSANRSQIALGYDSQSMAIRRYYNGTWDDWKTIAFTTSNVASAAKLNTARTIWGQSFDGTGNVDGNLKFGGDYCIQNSLGESVFHAYNNYTIVGYDNCPNKKDTYIDGYKLHLRTGASRVDRLFIDETGNVGIGIVPGRRLHVDGVGRFTSGVETGGSLSLTQSDGSSGHGLSLYSSESFVTSYGIMFGVTSKWGTHNITNGDWATYLTMDGATNRGWIFRHHGNGNVASITADGQLTVNKWVRTMDDCGWFSQTYGGGIHMSDSQLVRIYGGKILFVGTGNESSADYNTIGLGGHDLTMLVGSSKRHASIMIRSSSASWSLCSNSNGNMYIGKRNGTSHNAANGDAYALMLSGQNLLCYGGITMYSDIRKKTKLQDVELSLKQIADAPLIEHYYNSDDKRTTHVGSIAQYWAGLNDWFCKLDSEGFYTMEIQNAALASAISIARELVKYESKTDKEIRLLKDEVKRLKKEIKILKSA